MYKKKIKVLGSQKQKMDEETVMFRYPPDNFQFWDEAEVDVLEHYMMTFANNRQRANPQFMENWGNCEKALNHFHERIAALYIAVDPYEPLKQAIKEGRVVSTYKRFSDDTDQLNSLLEKHESGKIYEKLDEPLGAYVIRRLSNNQEVTITLDQYKFLKSNLAENELGLFYQLRDSHITILAKAKEVYTPEYYDPKKHGHLVFPHEHHNCKY